MEESTEIVVGTVIGVQLSGGSLAPVLVVSKIDGPPAFSPVWCAKNVTFREDAAWRRWRGPSPRALHKIPALFDEGFAARVVEKAEAHAAVSGGWTTRRHTRYVTCDLPVSLITGLAAEVFALLEAQLMPAVSGMYGLHKPSLSMRDVFVVKYDATEEGSGFQRGLEMHEDGSEFSFNALLSNPADFSGGGTRFEGLYGGEPVQVGRGEALVHAGSMRHEGVQITSGQRYVLVGFLKYQRGDPDPEGESGGVDDGSAETAYCGGGGL